VTTGIAEHHAALFDLAGSSGGRGAVRPWSGRAVAEARAQLEARTVWPTVCGRCGKKVDRYPASGWTLGHIAERGAYPELTWEPSNWRVEHRSCSNASGQQGVIAKARRDALRGVVSSGARTPGQSPPLPFSLPDAPGRPLIHRPGLLWDVETLARSPWLLPLLDVPEDAAPPLLMTPVPADAVGTYGWDAVEWIEWEQGITLRWWQRLSIVRQLEHRADGSLCHRVVIDSGPRRIGKSVKMRGGALWRMANGEDLFGEVQTIVHTGSDVAICREIQRAAWRWAEERAHWEVTRGNGKEQVETPNGDRWLVRAQDAVYGYDVTQGLVDEAWDVKPDTVDEGLEPATLERSSAQLVLTSTAHRRARSTMRQRITDAITTDDPEVLLLLWGAPPDADFGDPEVWRAASPHWSEDRRKMIAAKYAKALRGEDDPEFDDPDPMAGFAAQYLNVWRLAERRVVGTAVVTPEAWGALAVDLDPVQGPPASVAVESWFSDGVSVARAWRLDGRVVVRVEDFPNLDQAAATVAGYGCARRVVVGASLVEHPAWQVNGVRVTKRAGTTRTAVGDLQRALANDELRHDGSDHLTGQVLAVRTTEAADGPRIRSTGRADALKAAVWAAADAPTERAATVVVPTRYRRTA
jgi:hypothetical protein